jgi:hypothetical protein
MLGEGGKPCCRAEWPDAATVTLLVDGNEKRYDTPVLDVRVRARGMFCAIRARRVKAGS